MGYLCQGSDEISDFPNREKGCIPLKKTDYAVFRTGLHEGESAAEKMKELIHYAHGIWREEHKEYRIHGFCLLEQNEHECCYLHACKKEKVCSRQL